MYSLSLNKYCNNLRAASESDFCNLTNTIYCMDSAMQNTPLDSYILTHCSLVDFSTLIYWKSPFAT